MSTMNRSNGIAVVVAALGVGTASAQTAQPAASGTRTDDELQEVVISGIRASLEQAADIKRNADVIVDSIATEDLGKFPEANVAEALQRVTAADSVLWCALQ